MSSTRAVLLALIILVAPPVLFRSASLHAESAKDAAVSEKAQKSDDADSEPELATLVKRDPNLIFKELKARDRIEKMKIQRGARLLPEPVEKESRNPALTKFSDLQLFNALTKGTRGLFGSDDRKEVSELSSSDPFDLKVKNNARSVVAFIPKSLLKPELDGSFTLSGQSLSSTYGLCKDELFEDQMACAFCTGFLVAPDLVATAGHCLDPSPVQDTYIVFDYMTSTREPNGITRYSADQVYSIKEVVHWINDKVSDWGVLRLDRAATDRHPLRVRTKGLIANGSRVYVLGYPEGLPMKVARNGAVVDNSNPIYFTNNVDTLPANSGSPIFNQETHVVEGINVRGIPSLFLVKDLGCKRHVSWDSSKDEGNNASRTERMVNDLPLDTKFEILHHSANPFASKGKQ